MTRGFLHRGNCDRRGVLGGGPASTPEEEFKELADGARGRKMVRGRGRGRVPPVGSGKRRTVPGEAMRPSPAMETQSSEVGREQGQGVPQRNRVQGSFPPHPFQWPCTTQTTISGEAQALQNRPTSFSVPQRADPYSTEDPPTLRPESKMPQTLPIQAFSLSKQLLSAVNMSHHGGSKNNETQAWLQEPGNRYKHQGVV